MCLVTSVLIVSRIEITAAKLCKDNKEEEGEEDCSGWKLGFMFAYCSISAANWSGFDSFLNLIRKQELSKFANSTDPIYCMTTYCTACTVFYSGGY